MQPEWIWLLHDDSTPAPTALAELLAAAEADPGAAILGPKLREWPSLRRLLEVGVTISGTGRRETGLERSEYDQGQHDDVRRVLAVNTAGMLVRRELLRELGGFDRHLPIFGNDVDFGWRAAAAGHRTIVVPQAVVFHAEAAHRGSRRTPLTGRHTHYQERRAALWTLLVNGRARSLPWRLLRLAGGTLVRMIGFLLVRSVGEALDELAALLSVYSRPGQLLAARRERRRLRTDPDGAAALLSPWWVPYRHGLDFVSDLAAALTNQAADVAERRRAAALAQAAAEAAAGPAHSAARTHQAERRTGDGDEDDDLLEPDTGLLTRLLTSPVALALTLFVVAVLAGTRQAWGTVSGGALVPGARGRVGLVGSLRRELARARARLRRARAGVPAPALAPGQPARRQPGRGGERRARAGRAPRALGRVAPGPRGGPVPRPRRDADVAGRGRRCDVRPRRGSQRRLGRRPAGPGARGGRAALAGARDARVRRPGGGPALAGGVAHRAAARAGDRVRTRGLPALRRARAGRARDRRGVRP